MEGTYTGRTPNTRFQQNLSAYQLDNSSACASIEELTYPPVQYYVVPPSPPYLHSVEENSGYLSNEVKNSYSVQHNNQPWHWRSYSTQPVQPVAVKIPRVRKQEKDETQPPKKRGRPRKAKEEDATNGKIIKISSEAAKEEIPGGKANTIDLNGLEQGAGPVSEGDIFRYKEVKQEKIDQSSIPTVNRKSAKTERESNRELDAKRRDSIQANKAKMPFMKGTFLIQLSDVDEQGTVSDSFVWCVDNHILLIKYVLSGALGKGLRIYTKTTPSRYTGYYCDQPHLYYPLKAIQKAGLLSDEIIIELPKSADLLEAKRRMPCNQVSTSEDHEVQGDADSIHLINEDSNESVLPSPQCSAMET